MSVKKPVLTGLDLVEKLWPRDLKGARVGLVAHPASVDRGLVHAVDLFRRSKKLRLSALFGPQHGIHGQTQDNMVEWEGFRDPSTGLPVYSLYGQVRKPTREMLKDIDVLAIDLQDVGSRYYTFIWTLDLCMQACREEGKSVVVLDRPNPLGGRLTEGPVLQPAYRSFVGLRPLPVRHGMTIAEIGHYLEDRFHPGIHYRVIPMQGWRRRQWFDETGIPWVLPSPNMPTPDTALVYPGQVLLEGTVLSEGRGTTRPFELCGAPWVDPTPLCAALRRRRLPGAVFREAWFQPTFQKWSGQVCGGLQIHVTNPRSYRPYRTTLAILSEIRRRWPDRELWRPPPYEYETVRLPFDLLTGDPRIRKGLDAGRPVRSMERSWSRELAGFEDRAAAVLLYR
jgi:uncharacterized protein YbbC (DUF1343 family)